jgi:DNA mismatch endonuclease (patch repair protein)
VAGGTRAAAPPASSPAVRAVMRANRRRDTAPELAVRRELHARGRRFRVDHPLDLPPPIGRRRRADLVFPRARVAVFVDGCFWHGCPEHWVEPRSNREFWVGKIQANRDRDAGTDLALLSLGWSVVRRWEHDGPVAIADEVERALGPRPSGVGDAPRGTPSVRTS